MGSVVGGLRTSDAVSEVVRAEQVLGSIIMFGLIYLLLFVLWLYLLNNKIQHGPDDGTVVPAGGGRRMDLLEVAGSWRRQRGG